MTRAEFQHLAEDRLLDAHALLAANRWSAAYYLAGYAVECALKSCVLVHVTNNPSVIFVEKKFSDNCWTHDLRELVRLAGLKITHDSDISANPTLGTNWRTVNKWREISRYEQKTQSEAQGLYDAVSDATNGVFRWLKTHW